MDTLKDSLTTALQSALAYLRHAGREPELQRRLSDGLEVIWQSWGQPGFHVEDYVPLLNAARLNLDKDTGKQALDAITAIDQATNDIELNVQTRRTDPPAVPHVEDTRQASADGQGTGGVRIGATGASQDKATYSGAPFYVSPESFAAGVRDVSPSNPDAMLALGLGLVTDIQDAIGGARKLTEEELAGRFAGLRNLIKDFAAGAELLAKLEGLDHIPGSILDELADGILNPEVGGDAGDNWKEDNLERVRILRGCFATLAKPPEHEHTVMCIPYRDALRDLLQRVNKYRVETLEAYNDFGGEVVSDATITAVNTFTAQSIKLICDALGGSYPESVEREATEDKGYPKRRPLPVGAHNALVAARTALEHLRDAERGANESTFILSHHKRRYASEALAAVERELKIEAVGDMRLPFDMGGLTFLNLYEIANARLDRIGVLVSSPGVGKELHTLREIITELCESLGFMDMQRGRENERAENVISQLRALTRKREEDRRRLGLVYGALVDNFIRAQAALVLYHRSPFADNAVRRLCQALEGIKSRAKDAYPGEMPTDAGEGIKAYTEVIPDIRTNVPGVTTYIDAAGVIYLIDPRLPLPEGCPDFFKGADREKRRIVDALNADKIPGMIAAQRHLDTLATAVTHGMGVSPQDAMAAVDWLRQFVAALPGWIQQARIEEQDGAPDIRKLLDEKLRDTMLPLMTDKRLELGLQIIKGLEEALEGQKFIGGLRDEDVSRSFNTLRRVLEEVTEDYKHTAIRERRYEERLECILAFAWRRLHTSRTVPTDLTTLLRFILKLANGQDSLSEPPTGAEVAAACGDLSDLNLAPEIVPDAGGVLREPNTAISLLDTLYGQIWTGEACNHPHAPLQKLRRVREFITYVGRELAETAALRLKVGEVSQEAARAMVEVGELNARMVLTNELTERRINGLIEAGEGKARTITALREDNRILEETNGTLEESIIALLFVYNRLKSMVGAARDWHRALLRGIDQATTSEYKQARPEYATTPLPLYAVALLKEIREIARTYVETEGEELELAAKSIPATEFTYNRDLTGREDRG